MRISSGLRWPYTAKSSRPGQGGRVLSGQRLAGCQKAPHIETLELSKKHVEKLVLMMKV